MVTLGLHQVMGVELSAAATGSSAMLFGLGDDGLVLLFVAYREALARGLQPRDAVATLGGTGVSILLGAVTTTATFIGLWFMSFPSLQQLGLIVGVGILLTALFKNFHEIIKILKVLVDTCKAHIGNFVALSKLVEDFVADLL